MHLDHTRPLALLWQLDETATCLCQSCNSSKGDSEPSKFYTDNELIELAKITNIPLDQLRISSINMDAVEKIIEEIDWLFDVFCKHPQLNKQRDGKLTTDLFLKSLQKVFNQTNYGDRYNLIQMYRERTINN